MTTLIRNLWQGFDASWSSIDTDYLTLSVDNVRGIAHLVGRGVKLKERQCRDLSFKLVKTMESIQKLVLHSGALAVPFRPALENFYRILEKAKLLVNHCSETDWCRAAIFQIHNEETFRLILLEVGLCYNVIYEQAKAVMRDSDWRLFLAENFCQLSMFLPASESDVLEDHQSLEKSLEHLAGTSDDLNQCLARYLLGRLKCISKECINEDFSMLHSILWVNETESHETWKLQRVIGSGSGASCVCSYKWLGIPCARKEFHCKVADGIFRREAAILARLNHPNIVKFFCCSNGPKKGECFIAMELMDMSLDDLIESRRNAGQGFPIRVALDIIAQIAWGMCYLHDLKIAHRDLKPQNVVVSEIPSPHLKDNFSVKLVDFGMSKTKVQISKSNTISMPGVGTTTYRAPEVFPEAHQGDKRKVNWFQADAYSFAVTCGALLSLEEPYQGVRRCNLYGELLSGRRPELPRECPENLAAVLKKCWDTNPQLRPSFVDICITLEKCKLHDVLRRESIDESGGLQRLMGYEYIESVLKKQALVQPQYVTTISYDSDQTESNTDCGYETCSPDFQSFNLDCGYETDFENALEDIEDVEIITEDYMKIPDLESGKEISPVTLELHMRKQRSASQVSRKKPEPKTDNKAPTITKWESWLKMLNGALKTFSKDGSAKGGIHDIDSSWRKPQKVKVKLRQKSSRDLSDLHLSQEIQAHQGAIWTMKFSPDGHYLASAGQDRVVYVWEVVDHPLMAQSDLWDGSEKGGGNLGRKDGSIKVVNDGSVKARQDSSVTKIDKEGNMKSRKGTPRKQNSINHCKSPVPKLFWLSEKPMCSFQGHTEDILDLSWSRSQFLLSSSMDKTVRLWHISYEECLRVFSHDDYVTCAQFNPLDDRYFLSGSLDDRVRIWSIPEHHVVAWNDLQEMVTAVCYTPDGKEAIVGSYRGTCRFYNATGNKLQLVSQVDVREENKKALGKKITGLHCMPGDSQKVLVTSNDSCIRIYDDLNLVAKYKGLRNTRSQIYSSLSPAGDFIISASEDSRVLIWNSCNRDVSNRTSIYRRDKQLSCEEFTSRHVSVAIAWPDSSTRLSSSRSAYELLGKSNEFGSVQVPNEPKLSPPREENVLAATKGSERSIGNLGSGRRNSLAVADELTSTKQVEDGTKHDRELDASPVHVTSEVSVQSPSSDAYDTHSGEMAPPVDLVTVSPAWGLVIVTASLTGNIATYQNYGFPVQL